MRQKNGIPESAMDAKCTQGAKMANKCIKEEPKSPVIPEKVSKVKQMKDKSKCGNQEDNKATKKGQTFTCAICDKQFSSKQNVKTHIKSAYTIKHYMCKICHKSYSQPPTLRGHYRTVHEGYCFKCNCEDCNQEFVCKDQLKVHILEYNGKYQFICECTVKVTTIKETLKVTSIHI